jgi:hypothetical protein
MARGAQSGPLLSEATLAEDLDDLNGTCTLEEVGSEAVSVGIDLPLRITAGGAIGHIIFRRCNCCSGSISCC